MLGTADAFVVHGRGCVWRCPTLVLPVTRRDEPLGTPFPADLETTFSSYTRFVSRYLPAAAYETSLASATSESARARTLLVQLDPLEKTVSEAEQGYWSAVGAVLRLHEAPIDATNAAAAEKKREGERIRSALQRLAQAGQSVQQAWKGYEQGLDRINSAATAAGAKSKQEKKNARAENLPVQISTEIIHATLERSLIILGYPTLHSGVLNECVPTPEWERWNKGLGRMLGKQEHKQVRAMWDALRAEGWNQSKRCWIEAIWTLVSGSDWEVRLLRCSARRLH